MEPDALGVSAQCDGEKIQTIDETYQLMAGHRI
jgi:hypothetical protein